MLTKNLLRLSLCFPLITQANVETYANYRMDFYSDIAQQSSLLGHWKLPKQDIGYAVSSMDVATGIRYQRYQLEIIYRERFYGRTSADTIRFANLISDESPLPVGEHYSVHTNINSATMDGVRAAITVIQNDNIDLKLGATYLRTRYLIDAQLDGDITINGENDYTFEQMRLSSHYSTDPLLGHEAPRPRGYGYSLDASFDWKLDTRSRIQVVVRDVLTRIYWQAAPKTDALLESDNKTYNENGYIKINPTISGIRTTEDYVQRLPFITDVRFFAPMSERLDGILSVYHTPLMSFVSLGGQYHISESTRISSFYYPDFHSFALGFDSRWISAYLAARRFDLRESEHIAGAISIRYDW